jgi:hypothetical protein
MGKLRKVSIAVTTVGEDGAAVGSTTTPLPIKGLLHTIAVDYHASCPATADLTVTDSETGVVLLALGNNTTDVNVTPRKQCIDYALNSALSGIYDKLALYGKITAAIAQAKALAPAATIHLYIEE